MSLAEGQLKEGKSVILKAEGNSMLPFIRGGEDKIVLHPVSRLRKGQIVLARLTNGQYILHRIIKVYPAEVLLMGDANIRQTERCPQSRVYGYATRIIRGEHSIACTTRGAYFKASAWQFLLPLRRYLLFLYKNKWKRN